jgi:exopolysaccharide biosynthesis predicted pyruvyltransferase EpsI
MSWASCKHIPIEIPVEAQDSTDGLMTSLYNEIGACLDPLLPIKCRVALLDFPDYPNVGDNLLWLGELQYLRRRKAKIAYACEIGSCSSERLAKRLGNGTILLSGGGNFGDLYPRHQRFRERIISTFQNNKIIQLPQSIHFEHRANALQARQVLTRHPDFTLLVRDRKSFEFVEQELRVNCVLCPDMAFALNRFTQPGSGLCDIVWLSRSDKESLHYPSIADSNDIEKIDWPTDLRTVNFQIMTLIDRQFVLHPNFLNPLSRLRCFTLSHLANQRLKCGAEILGRGRVVVTDRLHGYILALLMGLPHIILNNSYGKVRNFHETWTKSSNLTKCADTPEVAIEMARAWMRQMRAEVRGT